jgi:hypothetical protein
MRHQDGKGHEVQAGERFGQAFVVASQAAEACHPGKAAFDHPAARQQNEASLGRRQLNNFESNAVLCRSGGRFIAGVTRSTKATLTESPVASWTVAASSATCDRSCALAGVTVTASNWPKVSTAKWTFEPFRRLWPS